MPFNPVAPPAGSAASDEVSLSALSQAVTAAAEDPARAHTLEGEFHSVYEEHAAALIRFATSLTHDPEAARDAVQESFIRYLEHRRSGATLQQPKAWLIRVVRNQLIDESRRNRRHDESGEMALAPVATALGHDWVEEAQLWERIEKELSAKEFVCFKLRAAGLSYAEIAKALGVRSGTVSMYLTRCREKLATVLNG